MKQHSISLGSIVWALLMVVAVAILILTAPWLGW